MEADLVYKSSRLVYKGLLPKANAEKDAEYKDLLKLCLSSHEFIDAVSAVAEGLSLAVVDISERGIILTPLSSESRFAMGLSEYRKELEGDSDPQDMEAKAKRGLIALVQVAIAATFFPTADDLDDDDYEVLGKSAAIKDMNSVLMNMCENIISEEDQELIAPSLKKGAELVFVLPETLPNAKIPTLKYRYGAITIIAKHLEKSGMLNLQKTSDGEVYFPTYKYQQLLKRRSVGRLFDLCHEYSQANEAVQKATTPGDNGE
jgi:hypothetical protein